MTPAEVWDRKIKPRLRTTESGCWEFTGNVNQQGYGAVWMDGKHRSTHRITAAAHLGLDLTDSATNACHRCDNPPCCNPDHLFLGSSSENTRDAIAKGRRAPRPPNAFPRQVCEQGHDLSVTRRQKSRNDNNTECGVCRRERHTEYMRGYRQRQRERAS